MAEVTRVYRRRGLIGDDSEELILKGFEWDAAAFFAAPAKLARTRRINGGQYVEYTYVRDDMAIFKAAEPATSDRTGARSLSDKFKTRLTQAKQRIQAADGRMDQAMSQMDASVNVAEQIAKDVEREAAELQASLGQLTNNPPE